MAELDTFIPKYIPAQNKKSYRDFLYLFNILCLYSSGFCSPPDKVQLMVLKSVSDLGPAQSTFSSGMLILGSLGTSRNLHSLFLAPTHGIYGLFWASALFAHSRLTKRSRSPYTTDLHLLLALTGKFWKYSSF